MKYVYVAGYARSNRFSNDDLWPAFFPSHFVFYFSINAILCYSEHARKYALPMYVGTFCFLRHGACFEANASMRTDANTGKSEHARNGIFSQQGA